MGDSVHEQIGLHADQSAGAAEDREIGKWDEKARGFQVGVTRQGQDYRDEDHDHWKVVNHGRERHDQKRESE